jgi:UDP-N-acetyl-D-mannosaminuronic acid transferase (WecB/TagA/CpsF family)
MTSIKGLKTRVCGTKWNGKNSETKRNGTKKKNDKVMKRNGTKLNSCETERNFCETIKTKRFKF